MDLIYSLEKNKKNDVSIFLAGPTIRINDNFDNNGVGWRDEAIKIFKKHGFDGNIIIPEFKNGIKPKNWTYGTQIDWEIDNLSKADVVLFWIPRDLKKLPAFTTNIEFGEYFKSGKISIGSPSDAPKMDYLKYRCKLLDINWNDSLEKTIIDSLSKINKNKKSNIFFTSDTHFNQNRTLELSKRPFNNVEIMNDVMVNNWNNAVKNTDIVFHLGDFGDPKFISKLNAKKIFIVPGNYDKEDILNELVKDSRVSILTNNKKIKYENKNFVLIHEIEFAKDFDDVFYLFGHTHGRQMVKPNGLDVGVDCHHFFPISLDTVLFYVNAIKNFYDINVFSQNIPTIK